MIVQVPMTSLPVLVSFCCFNFVSIVKKTHYGVVFNVLPGAVVVVIV
jgi:hypothetical protein